MAEYLLSARITAEISNFQRNMGAASNAANELAQTTTSTTTTVGRNVARINALDVNGFNRALQRGEVALNRYAYTSGFTERTVAQLPRTLNATGAAVTRSTQNFTNFNRVIQDAPYGINGIANNLQQLIPGVGYASVAINLLLTAVTFASVGFGAWTRGLVDNDKAIKNSKKSADEYADSLDDLTKYQLKGLQSSNQEIVNLKALYSVTQDTTISLDQRKKAVNALQDQYPAYFKNIKDEAFLTGAADLAYQNLTKSIIATAKARTSAEIIAKNANRSQEDEQKINDLQVQRAKIIDAETKRLKDGAAFVNSQYTDQQAQFKISEESLQVQIDSIKNRSEIKNLDEQIINLSTDQQKLLKSNLQLEKEINKQVKLGADLTGKVGSMDKTDRQRFNKTDIGKVKSPTLKFNEQDLTGLFTAYNVITDRLGPLEATISQAQARMLENAIAFNEQFTEITNTGLSNALTGLGDAIGTAIAEGGNVFQAIGTSLLSSLGGVLIQIGEMAIQIGVGLAAIKTALKSLNPVVAIAAGVGLIALGTVFQGQASKIGSGIKGGGTPITAFANGGIVSGPTNALIGEYSGARNNPEVVAPLNKLRSLLRMDNETRFQLIPIVDSKGIAILAKNGQDKLNRQ